MTFPRRGTLEQAVYRFSKRRYRIFGHIPEAVISPFSAESRRVFLVHNPKCAGSSLKQMLGISARRTTHSWPRDLFRPDIWEENLFVVAVRHPFERFLSSWRYHCRSGYQGKLVKRHGSLLHLSPLSYFDFIQQYPENLGLQSMWVDYPSAAKPSCDIVLRTEESSGWVSVLANHGILAVTGGTPQLNATSENRDFDFSSTELSAAAFEELRNKVEDFYRSDYLRFGYRFAA